jgi:predicted  nucleic acid-binding Zn-ribbon protein
MMKGICIYYERKNDHCTRFNERCKGADNCFCFVDSDLQERGNRMKDNAATVAQLTVENSGLKHRITECEAEIKQLYIRIAELKTELEAENERLERFGVHSCANCKYDFVCDKLNYPPCNDCGFSLEDMWEPED